MLIIVGILIYLPIVIGEILEIANLKSDTIPYLNEILDSSMYIELVSYSKLILTVGIIFLVISLILKKVFDKTSNFIKSYAMSSISAHEKTMAEVSKQNDMEIKLKQERAKNTHVVYCPHCGADNMLTAKVGKCKYCRRQIQYEE